MALIRYIAVFLLFYFVYKMVMGLFRSKGNSSSFADTEMKADRDKKHQKLIHDDEGEYVDYEDIDK
ncbi:MAG: hypothetical protein KAH17_07595 [Bacteroidales bacterium]|nr:hypothetical protein [Bacteroidales bacterium]